MSHPPDTSREQALIEILKVISSSRHDERPVLDVILKHASGFCQAPMAGLVLITEDRRHYTLAAAHGAQPAFVDFIRSNPPALDPKRFAAARAMVERKTVHIPDLSAPGLYGAKALHRRRSIALEGMRTSLMVPLISGDRCIGSICLWRHVVKAFADDDIALVEAFAEQAVIAIENVRQFRALEDRKQEVQALNDALETRVSEQVAEIARISRLRRFLSPAVAEEVMRAGEGKLMTSRRPTVAILFADIRGFTAFCEAAQPQETVDLLDQFHHTMGDLLSAHGAGVDQRAGDGLMAVFNDPLPCADPAGDAVNMALAMRDRMADLCRAWARNGHHLGFGIGISLGPATVGMFGSEDRYEYVASGTTTNLAARLCDRARDGEILLTSTAAEAVKGRFDLNTRAPAILKGFADPIDIHQVTARAGS